MNSELTRTRFSGRYSDVFGNDDVEFETDGTTLRCHLRGVEIYGTDFELLEPVSSSPPDLVRQFSRWCGCLCSFSLTFDMPIGVSTLAGQVEGRLQAAMFIGDSARREPSTLRLTLVFEDNHYCGSGRSGWFENELLEIQELLPPGIFIKACINCLYSDYSPAGHGFFGGLNCFRFMKQEYLVWQGKMHLLAIQNAACSVQETFLCPEFERRIPGTGYRG